MLLTAGRAVGCFSGERELRRSVTYKVAMSLAWMPLWAMRQKPPAVASRCSAANSLSTAAALPESESDLSQGQ